MRHYHMAVMNPRRDQLVVNLPGEAVGSTSASQHGQRERRGQYQALPRRGRCLPPPCQYFSPLYLARARRTVPSGSRPLCPVRVARLPVGPPHPDRPGAQGARVHHRRDLGQHRHRGPVPRPPQAGPRRRLGLHRPGRRRRRGPAAPGHRPAAGHVRAGRPRLPRPRDGAGAVGQEGRHHGEQRELRDYQDALLGLRRPRPRAPPRGDQGAAGLVTGAPQAGDRGHERVGVYDREQRRVPDWLCQHARGLRHRGGRLVRLPRPSRAAPARPWHPVSVRGPHHRGRHPPLHHPDTLRCGLSPGLLVQQEVHPPRLPGFVSVAEAALLGQGRPGPGCVPYNDAALPAYLRPGICRRSTQGCVP